MKDCVVENYNEVEIYNQFDNRCFNCGSDEKLTIDHIIPISKNGDDVKYNLCVLCGNCNSSKKDKYPEEFYSKEKLEKLYLIKGRNHATTSRNNHGHCD